VTGDRILLAYATRYGSTGEVAEAVGATLREQGLTVDVRPVKAVKDLGGFDAVVLGMPFYIGSMLKDAVVFLERHRAALQAMPVALLALGPTRASDDMAEARKQLDGAVARLGWLEPVAAEMFVGKYDPARLRLLDRLISLPPASPLHGVGAHDERDWDAIRSWAIGLPAALGLEPRDAFLSG
jgi:menaquinone-dependent protoporphyrinogen oxidase